MISYSRFRFEVSNPCLILNDMFSLESLSSQMVSSLSSLQLFSMYSTEGSTFKGDDERRLLEELEQLEHIDEPSTISLWVSEPGLTIPLYRDTPYYKLFWIARCENQYWKGNGGLLKIPKGTNAWTTFVMSKYFDVINCWIWQGLFVLQVFNF